MTPTQEIVCAGPAATKAVGAAIAKTLLPGDVLLLDGDLGAGKTTFTQGLARAMGVREPVTSPTFTLVRSYPTAFGVELIHVDVYRLDGLFDIVSLGLPEMLENGAVAAIEWGGRAAPALGPEHLDVRLTLTETEGERMVALRPSGSRWQARWPDLMTALEELGPVSSGRGSPGGGSSGPGSAGGGSSGGGSPGGGSSGSESSGGRPSSGGSAGSGRSGGGSSGGRS